MKFFRKLIIPTMFIAGFIIFFYPIVSNWLSTKDHYTVINKHNEALANMSEDEIEEERKKAEEYNETVQETLIPITDPFSDENEDSDEEVITGYFDVLDIGEAIGYLEIPTINAELPIYHGVSDEVLQRGIGHMSNSSFPIGGLGTHSALTGHRGLPSSKLFRHLDKVKEGDHFFIHTLGETLAYEVNDIKVVLPHETNWLEIDPHNDYVTLITCEPYMINTHRLLVRGERVPYVEETLADSSPDLNNKLQNNQKWVLISSVLGILVLTLYYLWQKRLRERGKNAEK